MDQLFARSISGTISWYLTDRLGSVRTITNVSGTVLDTINYDGFGNVTGESSTSNGDRYKWTARELDSETDLQYNRPRYYSAFTGRWIARDPLGLAADDSNLYRYVLNNSTNASDPTGQTPFYSFEVNDRWGTMNVPAVAFPPLVTTDFIKVWAYIGKASAKTITSVIGLPPPSGAIFNCYHGSILAKATVPFDAGIYSFHIHVSIWVSNPWPGNTAGGSWLGPLGPIVANIWSVPTPAGPGGGSTVMADYIATVTMLPDKWSYIATFIPHTIAAVGFADVTAEVDILAWWLVAPLKNLSRPRLCQSGASGAW